MDKIEKQFEQLTEIMLDGFDRVYTRIDGLDNRMGGLDNRMGGLEQRMDGIDNRMDRMESNISDIRLTQSRHTETLHEHTVILKRVSGDIEALVKDDLDHGKRIKRLERKALPGLV